MTGGFLPIPQSLWCQGSYSLVKGAFVYTRQIRRYISINLRAWEGLTSARWSTQLMGSCQWMVHTKLQWERWSCSSSAQTTYGTQFNGNGCFVANLAPPSSWHSERAELSHFLMPTFRATTSPLCTFEQIRIGTLP